MNGSFGAEAAGPGPDPWLCRWRYFSCQVTDEVGRSYFDIPTGQSQLFSEK